MNTVLYIKHFALYTYYGIRQWLLQFTLFFLPCEIAIWSGYYLGLSRFGVEGLYMTGCMFFYTMFFYWFRTFTSHLHPLLQVIIPYIPYALIVYLEIVSKNDCNFKGATIDNYILEGWLLPIYSLMIIGLEHTLKRLLTNNKVTRIIKIIYNVATILLATFIAIVTILVTFY